MSLLAPLVSGVTRRKRQLLDDFAHWRERTGARPAAGRAAGDPVKPDLPEHQSQVERITRQLERLLEHIDVDGLDALPADQRIDRAREARSAIHHVHLIWDFFRRKLTLRETQDLRNMLLCADDFAWECFEPMMQRGLARNLLHADSHRAPPLVYLADEQGPLMRGRDSGFAVTEPRDVPTELVHQFREVGKHLPVPIIGLPWHDANRLPPLIHIAHEVGHVVADDLAWLPEIERQITESSEIADGRKAGWTKWADEVAADAFGVACAGDAYVAMLSLELLEPRAALRNDRQPDHRGRWKRYPTSWLRMYLARGFRETLKYPDEGAWSAWTDACGESHSMAEWQDDVPAIAAIVCKGEHLGALGITDLAELQGGPAGFQAHTRMARALRQSVPGNFDSCRTLVVGAALAYIAMPERFDAEISGKLFKAYARSRAPSVREQKRKGPTAEQIARQAEADARSRDSGLASLLGIPVSPAEEPGD